MEHPLREEIKKLPGEPGIYRFLDRKGTLIYVGKAKDLKKRVTSYFTKSTGHSRKTLKLVSETAQLEFTVTNTEFEALLLENNFIKQYQPKYNILLKDDKTYPYLCILKERFPRIISTRKFIPEEGEYFGPFTSVTAMNNVLDLIRRLYTIRTCSLNLSPENIAAEKFKVCLEFHIGNCKAPCIGLVREDDYNKEIKEARNIIRGDLTEVARYFEQEMTLASSQLAFEQAAQWKRKLDLLEKFRSKHAVFNRSLTEVDVITITSDDQFAWVNFMQIREGAIIYSQNREIEKKLEESDADLIALAYTDMRTATLNHHQEILTNISFEHPPESTLFIPQIGDKKKLITLSITNAETLRLRRMEAVHLHRNDLNILTTAKQDLHLRELPVIIECFDNSNLQGTNPVASMVRFENARPKKSEYRHYNIKTVTGPNDFASMHEIVTRRYTRLKEEHQPLPNLVVVDGGKGQLSSAVDALKSLGLYGTIPIIGIAKDLEELYFPEDSLPLMLSKRSTTLRLIQQMRDEAHRFGITFHRKKRSKAQLSSAADNIPGIGQATMDKLLKEFRSMKKIREASLEELSSLIGRAKAELILKHSTSEQ
ncbi:MAG: excinuclease ABC subunit UvrC [Bacteroidota bacterium]